MKLEDIVAKVAPTVGMAPADLMRGVDAVFEGIKAAVAQGEKVSVARTGSFMMKSKSVGEKVDEATGSARPVDAISGMSFKPLSASTGGRKIKPVKDKNKPRKPIA